MFFQFQGGGDIYTLFLMCTFSSNSWRDIQKTLRSKLTLTDLSERTIKLGFIDGESFSITENHILLLFILYFHKDILTLCYQKWEVVRSFQLTLNFTHSF